MKKQFHQRNQLLYKQKRNNKNKIKALNDVPDEVQCSCELKDVKPGFEYNDELTTAMLQKEQACQIMSDEFKKGNFVEALENH